MGASTFAGWMMEQFTAEQTLELFFRIIVASVCGAAIGLERSRRLKVAGVRTHVIVCCSAALLMIVSKYGFADLTLLGGSAFPGTRGADPARVAAQVVSGVSFLGAGVIFKHGDSIKGLTTAAIVWGTAGIGLALGAGMYQIGVFATGYILLMQVLMHRLPFNADTHLFRLEFTVRDDAAFRSAFADYAKRERFQVVRSRFTRTEDGVAYDMTLAVPRHVSLPEAEAFFHENGEVSSVGFSMML